MAGRGHIRGSGQVLGSGQIRGSGEIRGQARATGQLGVTGQDALVQGLQLRARLDAEFAGQPVPHRPGHPQRALPLPEPVQRHDQQPGEPLGQRVLRQQPRQICRGLQFHPARQQRCDAVLDHRQALLGQHRRRGGHCGNSGMSASAGSSPQGQSLVERFHGGPPVYGCLVRRRPGTGTGARPPGLPRPAAGRLPPAPVQGVPAWHRGERLAYAGDQRLQAAARRTGRLIVPHRVNQLGNRHRLPGPQRPHAEHESLLRRLRWRPGAGPRISTGPSTRSTMSSSIPAP